MRIALPFLALTLAFTGLLGCSEAQVFTNISEVKVRQIGPNGLDEKDFDEGIEKKLKACLHKSKELPGDEGKQLLQSTYLIQVKDKAGERSFELYTESNLKGNKGKYYSNPCIYGLVR